MSTDPKSKNKPRAASSSRAGSKKTAAAKKSASSSRSVKKTTRESARPEKEAARRPAGLGAQLMPFIFLVAAVFFAVCLVAKGVGFVGGGIRDVLLGLFSGVAYTLPIYLILGAFMWRSDLEKGMTAWKIFCYFITFLTTTALMHFFADGAHTFAAAEHYAAGLTRTGGGVLGGMIGEAMTRAFGRALSLVLLFAVLFVFVLLMFGITPRGLYVLIAYKIQTAKERSMAERQARQEEEEELLRRARLAQKKELQHAVAEPTRPKPAARGEQLSLAEGRRNGDFSNLDVDMDNYDDDGDGEDEISDYEEPSAAVTEENDRTPQPDGVIDEKIFEEVMRRTQQRLKNQGTAADLLEAAQASDDAPENLFADPATPEEIPEKYPDAAEPEDDLPWEESIRPETAPEPPEDPEELEDEDLDLSKIFTDTSDEALLRRLNDVYAPASREDGEDEAASDDAEIELSVQRRQITEKRVPAASKPAVQPAAAAAPAKAEETPEYQFPPIDLLTKDENAGGENFTDELRDNAAKLVKTLDDFRVKTKIVDVCRGPTITRYELQPEPGTRVRSIANLVDDIALNLATAGVRVEAPIPGKNAVGIEVPNKNAATVHLRTLLENPSFAAAKSRINAALGQDVAGANVYLDIARMPHLLIAGATGMGKSVCINSLIVSLLYKARPDEVKLIMIDPKKVELSIYNGIPHLYMPVVSDAKKAAGALSWAVSEMERRYSLIEEVGVRDIKTYNSVTKDDPQYEFLPQFVIVIDELADLMMMAKKDVEESICRIAQKARAAGMHLIIGTQRPSVDVITGLIKANFPSRIAFRVSSRIDSGTIIDRPGAENLVGRGDMLYNPVGADKPIRVQGAYVSEEDVEKVVSYIRAHNSGAEYDTNAMEQIERNAASIGVTKKGASSFEDGESEAEEDPMLRSAIELAVESGKISTSLLQRRLSLGYGRAAKLIDRMEQLGYVSPPDGQKPREVRITKEEFMEMVLRGTAF